MSEKTRNETTITTPSDLEIRVEREFDASRELVWECFADPDLLSEWLGPRGLEIRIELYEFRQGGEWKYTHIDEDGTEYVFFGEFREMREPELIGQTFNFVMDPPIPPAIERLDLFELKGGRTRLVTNSTFESKDLRDGMVQSGMETGVNEGNERLDELLARTLAGAK